MYSINLLLYVYIFIFIYIFICTYNTNMCVIYNNVYLRKKRYQVLSHYSKGKPKCNCCGEDTYEFLVIDHINDDGGIIRRQMGTSRGVSGIKFMSWIIKNNYPKNLQILCANCNTAKSKVGVCPHKESRSDKYWAGVPLRPIPKITEETYINGNTALAIIRERRKDE